MLAAIGSGLALIAGDTSLQALDIRTGKLRWQLALPSLSPGIDRQIVAGKGAVALIEGGTVTLLGAQTGATRWSRPIDDTGVRYHPPAAITQGLLLVPQTSSDWVPYDE